MTCFIKGCRICPVLVILAIFAILQTASVQDVQAADIAKVTIVKDGSGSKLQVDGKDFMVLGMNWDYVPIGKNYAYSLWAQSDDFIKSALANEMPLLKAMGVNTIRHYVGIPPRWVQYIYEEYGIYTVINHPLGRYGLTIDGAWVPSTDYSNEKARAILMAEMEALVEEFKDTPGMLFWLLGNENNYGLTWKSAETEALPEGERNKAKAQYLYSLFGEITEMIKSKDSNRPVAMANGDLQYIDIIAEEMTGLDIFGANVYRGISARDAFEVVKKKMGIPLLFTEFGADAFNAKTMQEDQPAQARYLIGQWQEIYEQSYGKGRVGNAIGGFTFQFSDGWWKYKQEENLEVHDINASWPNGGYQEDFVEGENNMNEEWWGICAKGFPDTYGFYDLYPRATYFALQKAYQLEPYGPKTDLASIRAHFANITPMAAALEARGNKAALASEANRKVRVSGLRMELEMISTGGEYISTPEEPVAGGTGRPAFQGFDHLESFYASIEAKPAANIRGNVTFNMLGNVPENPINEIFYEDRGQTQEVFAADSSIIDMESGEKFKIYSATMSWEHRYFTLDGFYRSGHYHWGYEGDFFGLYREAYYGENVDIYNGEAPVGFEITGKKKLSGLQMAMGPELWWGANPAILAKYQYTLGDYTITGVFQEDLDDKKPDNTGGASSNSIPVPTTRTATLHVITQKGPLTIELGGIWSGDNKVGQWYQFVKGEPGNYQVYQKQIESSDAFGGKFKISAIMGKYSWYVQGAAMGLVAEGGPTATQTFSGWWLKDSGKGNQRNIIAGVSARYGKVEIAPNFLWQKPLRGPIPSDVPQPGHPRNVRDDPFAVRENREMTAFELIVTYDPTPATWMYHWDSDVREDAGFAFTSGLILKSYKTTMDAALFFDSSAGNPIYAFPGATPARDVWEWYGRYVFKLKPELGIIANLFAGEGEPNGDDPRLIERYGGDIRLIYGTTKVVAEVRIDDWGPYDYHRDHNLTYPLQLMADVSTTLGNPDWLDLPQTRFGVRAMFRSLDEFSPRFNPPGEPGPDGSIIYDSELFEEDSYEWEIRTYLHMNIGL